MRQTPFMGEALGHQLKSRRAAPARRAGRRRQPFRDVLLCSLAVLSIALLLGHGLIPEDHWAALFVESFLPWLGVAIVALALLSIVGRSLPGGAAAVAAALCWCLVILPGLQPASADVPAGSAAARTASAASLKVVTQNLRAGNPDPRAVVEKLVESDPDVVALQELTGTAAERISEFMDARFGYHYVVGTVGVWSRLPLSGGAALELEIGWSRALGVQVDAQDGPVQLYVVHLPSVRPGEEASRNLALAALKEHIGADTSPRLLVLGDFNAATTDRSFEALLDTVQEARAGFGFTWPSMAPATRPDHILFRGFTAGESAVITTPGTDHLAAFARLDPASDATADAPAAAPQSP